MSERCEGQALEFWLSIVASQASPVWLSSTAKERTPPFELHAISPSRFLPVLYYECGITLPRPFVSHKPSPKHHHLPLPFFVSFQFLASISLNIMTHHTLLPSTHLSLHISFHPRIPNPCATRHRKVGQITIASPVPRYLVDETNIIVVQEQNKKFTIEDRTTGIDLFKS